MFSQNLKQARKKAGLSQEELASELHVTRQALAKWESGENEPSIESINRLAEILEVNVSDLIGEGPTTSVNRQRPHFFCWKNLLRISAISCAICAIFLLFLPGVFGDGATSAYLLIFGSANVLINPLALSGWILLVIGAVILAIFFFLNQNRKIKNMFFLLALVCLLFAGILFLSCQCLNPRSLAGPSQGVVEAGMDPTIGLGTSFPADQLNDLAKALAIKTYGNIDGNSAALIEAHKNAIVARYSLIDGIYYLENSCLEREVIYAHETSLGPGFLSGGVLCLFASLLGTGSFWVKK